MSTVLAIDTSTATGRIAIAAGETVIFAREFTSQRSHNSQIFSPLETALTACNRTLDLVAVGTGPGSYTGVRIGIATGIGIAMALDLPVIGIPSACAAAADTSRSYTLIGDARRGATFIAQVKGHQLAAEPELLEDEKLRPRLDGCGSPLFTYDETRFPAGVVNTHPSASKIAVQAACLDDTEVGRLAGIPPQPIYLREPFVTRPKKLGKAVS
jgi:tRNA threonylcarbamoyladenosine biosynthesis protein TsaB